MKLNRSLPGSLETSLGVRGRIATWNCEQTNWENQLSGVTQMCISNFENRSPWLAERTWPLKVWFCAVLLLLVGGLRFQRKLHPQNLRHAAAIITNVPHGNVRNKKIIVRNLEERKFGTRCGSCCGLGHFSPFWIPGIAEKKRTECSWGRCSADPVAACYLYNSYRTWWTHQSAYISVVASGWCCLPMASGNAKSREPYSPHLVNSLPLQPSQPASQPMHVNFTWDAQWDWYSTLTTDCPCASAGIAAACISSRWKPHSQVDFARGGTLS